MNSAVAWLWKNATLYKQTRRCIFLAIDFFIKVSQTSNVKTETVFACLSIASKFTQDYGELEVDRFDNFVSERDVAKEEMRICLLFQWDLNCPVLCDFLDESDPVVMFLSECVPMTSFYKTNTLKTTAETITNMASFFTDTEQHSLSGKDETALFEQIVAIDPKHYVSVKQRNPQSAQLVSNQCENMEVEE